MKGSGFYIKPEDEMLYIPHGSDERYLKTVMLTMRHLLYIPHGSDESNFSLLSGHTQRPLYPTWFR